MIDPHPLWHAFQQHVIKSLPEYSIILGLLIVAIVANMPRPEVVAAWLQKISFLDLCSIAYKWLYDSLQAFMAARQGQQPHSTAVIQQTAVTPTVEPPKGDS